MNLTLKVAQMIAMRYGFKLASELLEDKKAPLPPDLKTLKLPDPDTLSGDEQRVVKYLLALQGWEERYRLEDDFHRSRETEPADMQASLDAMANWLQCNPRPQLSDY